MEGIIVVVAFWLIINKGVEVFKTKKGLKKGKKYFKGKNSTCHNYHSRVVSEII